MEEKPSRQIGVCLISQDRQLQKELEQVVRQINCWLCRQGRFDGLALQKPFQQILVQARQYLRAQGSRETYQLVLQCFPSRQLARRNLQQSTLTTEYFLADSRAADFDNGADPFAELLSIQPQARLSPSSAVLFCDQARLADCPSSQQRRIFSRQPIHAHWRLPALRLSSCTLT